MSFSKETQIRLLIEARSINKKYVTGVQRYFHELTEAFKQLHIAYDLALPKYENRAYSHLWELFYLPIAARNYDVLFCPANLGPLWKSAKTKLVVALHSIAYAQVRDAYDPIFANYYKFVVPKTLKVCDAVITVSETEKKRILGLYPEVEHKINVIQNGISDIFLSGEIKVKKENYILYVGSLNPSKNVKGLISAFERIKGKITQDLYIIGPAQNIFQNSDIKGGRVSYLGPINDKAKLKKYYENAALFVFPSLYEASPLPPSEAMACGCPVVASDLPELRERCEDGALYCDPNNIDDIAEKIIRVLGNTGLREDLMRKGREVARKYSWGKVAGQTYELFGKISR